MANITVRRSNPGALATGWTREPIRTLRDMLRWDPFQEMTPLFPEDAGVLAMPVAFEVKETPSSYLFKADVPGIKDQDLNVSLSGGRLTISGKRDQEKEDNAETYYAYERSYGEFSRSFTLPEGIDSEHVQAELKNGVLSVAIQKKAAAQPKQIPVKNGEKATAKA